MTLVGPANTMKKIEVAIPAEVTREFRPQKRSRTEGKIGR